MKSVKLCKLRSSFSNRRCLRLRSVRLVLATEKKTILPSEE